MTANPPDRLDANAVTRLIVGYNSADVLEYSYLPAEKFPTVLVDNASTDETIAKAKSFDYCVVPMSSNAGYSRAINAGLREISTPYALIINPDLDLPADQIENLIRAAERYTDSDVFVPRIFKPDGSEFFRFETRFEPRAKHRKPPAGDACIAAVSGAALLVRREPFLHSGGFDENIFLYFEDDDLALRLRRDRKAIVFVADARATHLGDQSSKTSDAINRLKYKSFGWGWAYCMKKHQLGNRAREFLVICAKTVGHVLVLDRKKLQRDTYYLLGFASACLGRPAPFPD